MLTKEAWEHLKQLQGRYEFSLREKKKKENSIRAIIRLANTLLKSSNTVQTDT